MLDVGEAVASHLAAGDFDHLRDEVGLDQPPGVQALGDGKPDLAVAARDLEERLVGERVNELEETLGDRSAECGDDLSVPLPTGRGECPRLGALGRLLAQPATPAKRGMMSPPYASSVSSCPWVIR